MSGIIGIPRPGYLNGLAIATMVSLLGLFMFVSAVHSQEEDQPIQITSVLTDDFPNV